MLHSHLWFQLEAFLARSSSEVLVELLTGDGCPESSPGLGLFQQFQHTHAFINALVVGAHDVSNVSQQYNAVESNVQCGLFKSLY